MIPLDEILMPGARYLGLIFGEGAVVAQQYCDYYYIDIHDI